MTTRSCAGCVLFDWGDTLMRVYPEYAGPMVRWPQVAALPFASETLQALHPDWLLGLATNAADSDEAEIRAALARVGLDSWIDRIYAYRTIRRRKPSPEFFEAVLEDLDLPRPQVIMVGDDLDNDVRGALACGLKAVWLNERSTGELQEPRLRTIHSLQELPGAIAELAHEPAA